MRFCNPGSVLVAAVFGLGITIGAIKVFAQGSCRNYYRDCPAWSRAGYCVSNRAHYMSLYCKRSCGWCGCADYNANCYFWSKRGQCALNRRYMSINCRRSCGQCRVNGGWGIWGQWGKCSKSCNTGRQRRFRKCNRPAPANGGKNCVGSFGQQRRCNIQKCANVKVDGAWGNWKPWTTCSKTCGKGIRRRMRKCDRPRPKNGGRYCIGASVQQQFCNILACPTASPVTATTVPSGSGYTCGLRSTRRIVGGTIASPRDWPWQVGLKRDGNGIIFCGGSLLNREWVLTAAHCIYRNFNPSRSRCVKPNPKLIVVLGEFDVKNVDGHEVHKEVSLMCMYPRYESSTLDYDITLLKLKTPIRRFNEYMRPICLPQNNTILRVGQSCYVTGFGRTKEYGQLSSHLREARVPVISSNKCTKLYAGRKVSSRMFCAAHAKGGIDSCKGDSGGPFVCRDIIQPGRWTLMGVVSWGVGCARGDSPGVYAKVSYFVDWINNTMKTA